jgi:hypothetical protein
MQSITDSDSKAGGIQWLKVLSGPITTAKKTRILLGKMGLHTIRFSTMRANKS